MGSSASKSRAEQQAESSASKLVVVMSSELQDAIKGYLSTQLGCGHRKPLLKRSEFVTAGLAYELDNGYYCNFEFYDAVCAREENCIVIVANVSLTENTEAQEELASERCDIFRKNLNIFSEKLLNEALIRLYLSSVQEELSSRVHDRLKETENIEVVDDEDEDDCPSNPWVYERQQERAHVRYLRSLKSQDTCICCLSTVVIITEKRVFVAGPGLLVVAIASPRGVRILSNPSGEHSEDVKISEFQGGLGHDEFLVMFRRTSDNLVKRVEYLDVSATEDVSLMCQKLCGLDIAGKPMFYVLQEAQS